jgi:hypothetical protein
MAQQGIVKTIPKEYLFKMSNTEIVAWSSSEQGIVVSGTTKFDMNIDASGGSRGTITGANYTIPDFTKTLIGTLTLDENTPIVELRKVPVEEAKRLIHQYLKEHPGSRTSDLIIELTLEPDIVIEALSQLRNEGKVEGKNVRHK